MAQNGRIWQKIKWLGSLMAIWLLVVLPARSAEIVLENERQAVISSTHPWSLDKGASDYASVVHTHAPIALLSPLAGFSFLSSPGFLPPLVPVFYRTLILNISGYVHRSYFVFGFLRPIFEHQITINAP
ncbi:hypothetical protein [Spirosoma endophyticum]|uniref:Uncharacterized protein n=1 Tax=Spirosoma endophyticum TaxID=662367 RepID=A0A1I2G1K5_9BACT|nr:hypothetical protein [Spirosoma endophyticum]SFF10953.1 hypothetical protein SAMN05216167_1297 [Spirosoma endophyticum]